MKLENGMYFCRKNKGGIYRCKAENYTPEQYVKYCKLAGVDCKKASYNIIDLIEVGDYVNGEKVAYVWNFKNGNRVSLESAYDLGNLDYALDDNDIKEILTHEQYEANCYKVNNNENTNG